MSLMKDAAFLAEVEKSGLEYAPLPGAEVQAMIEKSVDVSPAVIAKANALHDAGAAHAKGLATAAQSLLTADAIQAATLQNAHRG